MEEPRSGRHASATFQVDALPTPVHHLLNYGTSAPPTGPFAIFRISRCPAALHTSRKRSMSSKAAVARMVGKISADNSAMLLCDVQERFRSLIHHGETVIRTSKLLTSASKELNIPLVITEQYPKVFGPTIRDCFEDESHLQSTPTFPKKLFSMMTPEVSEHIKSLNATSFILFGIETHVCVQQTALDLLEMGHEVHIIVDGTSSQQALDREIALQRLSNAGAYLTTAQSILFMLLKGE